MNVVVPYLTWLSSTSVSPKWTATKWPATSKRNNNSAIPPLSCSPGAMASLTASKGDWPAQRTISPSHSEHKKLCRSFVHIWVCLPTRNMAFQDEKDAQFLVQMTDEEFWQRARAQAAQAATLLSPSASEALHQYLQCELQRGTWFAPLRAIEAVIPAPSPLARLPFAPPWLQGVKAWRGEI